MSYVPNDVDETAMKWCDTDVENASTAIRGRICENLGMRLLTDFVSQLFFNSGRRPTTHSVARTSVIITLVFLWYGMHGATHLHVSVRTKVAFAPLIVVQ